MGASCGEKTNVSCKVKLQNKSRKLSDVTYLGKLFSLQHLVFVAVVRAVADGLQNQRQRFRIRPRCKLIHLRGRLSYVQHRTLTD